jgi:hypothetical protein
MNDTADPSYLQPADLPPTEDERLFAMLAHLLQLFAGFIPPLVIFLVKKQSRFVAFHALQALLWQIAYFLLIMLGMAIFFVSMFGTLLHQLPKGTSNNAPPVGLFLGFGAVWLFFMIGAVVNLVLAIVFSIKAYGGKWSRYPIFGGLARRFLKM